MPTFFITHPICFEHEPNDGHPECPERLDAVMDAVNQPEFSGLIHHLATKAQIGDLLLAHSSAHIEDILGRIPFRGLNFINSDTMVSPMSGEAALYGVGAVLDAVESVLAHKNTNAFCAVRPPGHHAHREKAGSFCLFNNVAIGALAALKIKNLNRVAIVDFDVHHGDGTQDIVWDEENILFISMHQFPLYPGTGAQDECGGYGNVVNFPVDAGADGEIFRDLMTRKILPRLEEFKPDIIFVSAGFDAHQDDPLAGIDLNEDDFAFLMKSLCGAAHNLCDGRLVAVLEGGYDLPALTKSVAACLGEMIKA